jgi:hypothetical protein
VGCTFLVDPKVAIGVGIGLGFGITTLVGRR